MLNPKLVNALNAILNKMRLVSDLFDALSPPSMAPTVPIPPTCPLTKDYTLCTVQMDPIPAIMATLLKNSGQQSFAQAVKASAPWPSDKPPVAPASTLPTAPDSMPHTYMPKPFKGQRATKSNELHVQLRSCMDFNSSMLRYTQPSSCPSHRFCSCCQHQDQQENPFILPRQLHRSDFLVAMWQPDH